jgi:hypothetical protein
MATRKQLRDRAKRKLVDAFKPLVRAGLKEKENSMPGLDAINDLDGDVTPAMRRSEQAYIRRCMKGVPK